ncbi:MAG TPA: hypothetical protein VN809_00875 [Telmatospirillum sp.]|nr:hypothetical protein [Telmatospirillum sp.]
MSARTILLISLLGGAAGALLLIFTPQHTFDRLVPWLLLAATVLFAAGKKLTPLLRRHIHIGPATLYSVQFVIALYGGYTGAQVARKMNPDHVRAVVILIGICMTIAFFQRA